MYRDCFFPGIGTCLCLHYKIIKMIQTYPTQQLGINIHKKNRQLGTKFTRKDI